MSLSRPSRSNQPAGLLAALRRRCALIAAACLLLLSYSLAYAAISLDVRHGSLKGDVAASLPADSLCGISVAASLVQPPAEEPTDCSGLAMDLHDMDDQPVLSNGRAPRDASRVASRHLSPQLPCRGQSCMPPLRIPIEA